MGSRVGGGGFHILGMEMVLEVMVERTARRGGFWESESRDWASDSNNHDSCEAIIAYIAALLR